MADDDSIPARAVPGQGWKRLPWPDTPVSDASAETIMTSAGMFRAAESLLGEARSDWMTIRSPDWPLMHPIQLWPVPSAQDVHARAICPSQFTARPQDGTSSASALPSEKKSGSVVTSPSGC